MKKTKKVDVIGKVPKWAWLTLSLLTAVVVYTILSKGEVTSRAFPPLLDVLKSYTKMASTFNVFWKDVASSLKAVGIGFALGFLFGVPVAFVMAWYRPVRFIVEPWIQFVRNIPPLAYVPLVVLAAGIGTKAQVTVICIATFLTICITVFQGVVNVDETLIKAARVLGANDMVLFTRVIFPATTPFIITSVRLGISVALTTLVAAETTGAQYGLGMRVQALNSSFDTPPMMLYIIVIGVIGMLAEKILKFFERRLTSWQEKREI